METEDVTKLAKRKIAGIPVLYIVAIVGVVLLILAFRVKPLPEETATSDETEDEPESLDGDMASSPLVVNPVFTVNPSEASNTYVENTNEVWARKAIQWLMASGSTAGEATTAIQKYLSGENLSFAEGALRDKAVAEFGLPPEDFSSGKTLGYSGPASKQGEPPLRHVVKGKSDNTFAELSRLYYGLSNADAVNFLRSRTASLTEPFATGQSVTVPVFKAPKYYRATSSTRTLYAIARKNAATPAAIEQLNPGVEFPVKVGTRVRVR